MVVVLTPARWADWLYLARPEAELLTPLPPGSVVTTLVRPGADPVPKDLQGLASRFAVESEL
jgi:putative SOS response-associated peptidase YedK